MTTPRLDGTLAATHTPFHSDGTLNLAVVERQAAELIRQEVAGAFIGGTTGESHSLTLQERLQLTDRWTDVARGTGLKIVVHVGANCLADARALAAHAERSGAAAISAISPAYFKPRDVRTLVSCMAEIAAGAPATPFYYYDIPSMTGVSLPAAGFMAQAAEHIPTLAGLKFSHADLMSYQLCLRLDPDRFSVLWGCDEFLLAALVLGGTGAVGSTYNFAAPIYRRLRMAFADGDLARAADEQFRSVRLVQCLLEQPCGFMGAAKALMGFLDVPVGPARLPHGNPGPDALRQLRCDLDQLGFFDWIR